MVEVMASTHFLHGAHGCFINEFNGTRKIAIDKWLTAQCKMNSKMMLDDDVRKAVDRMQAEEFRRELLNKDRYRNWLAR